MSYKNGIHYSRENEKNILGCFMLSPDCIPWINRVKREWFYDDTNRSIFDTIKKLQVFGYDFNAKSVFMMAEGKIPPHLITDCMNHVPGGPHGFKYGLAMLQGMYNYRQSMTKANQPTTLTEKTKKPNDFE